MKRTQITSPLRADDAHTRTRNTCYAKLAKLHALVAHGDSPYVPHVDLTLVLDDKSPVHRDLGMRAAKAMIGGMEQVAAYMDLGLSDGMRGEHELATSLGIPIVERRIFDHTPTITDILERFDDLYLALRHV